MQSLCNVPLVAFDVETFPILYTGAGKLRIASRTVPELVCVSYATGTLHAQDVPGAPPLVLQEGRSGVLLAGAGLAFLRAWLVDPRAHFIAHNTAFDVAATMQADPSLVDLWLEAYDQGRVHDTMIREKLLDVATGQSEFKVSRDGKTYKPKHSLAELTQHRLGITVVGKSGTDAWRTRYNELHNVPVETWPIEAYEYALFDSVYALRVFADQALPLQTEAGLAAFHYVADEVPQTQAALAFHLSTANGLRSNPLRVEQLGHHLHTHVREVEEGLAAWSVEVQAKGQPTGVTERVPLAQRQADGKYKLDQRALRQIVYEAWNGNPPLTTKGEIATHKEAKEQAPNRHPALDALLAVAGAKHARNMYLKPLQAAAQVPICAYVDGVKESGRVGYGKPSLQNQPVKGPVRKCYKARRGFVFCNSDYDQIEMCSLGEVLTLMFGHSELANMINAGIDLHTCFGVEIYNASHAEQITYDFSLEARKGKHGPEWREVINFYRQRAKVFNFGKPGGMGDDKMVDYGESYGVQFGATREEAVQEVSRLTDLWLRMLPEMQLYFRHFKQLLGYGGRNATIVQPVSGRVRGDCSYTQACNTMFQGLAADGMKRAMWLLTRACYGDPSSPLYGSRVSFVVHDEFMLEIPYTYGWERVHAAAAEVARLMREGMQSVIRHVKVSCDPVLSWHWYKDAEPRYNTRGNLIPYTPDGLFSVEA